MTAKLVPLAELSTLIAPGQSVAVGGGLMSNQPMSAIREIVRARIGDLHVVNILGSIGVDMLVGAGLVRELTFSMVSLEAFGLAPCFRRAVETGGLRLNEISGVALNVALAAGGRRLPYLPMRSPGDTELIALNPNVYRDVTCPFSSEKLTAVRALNPDVAIIHALRADRNGNCQVEGPRSSDPELAMAAGKVIVTCEEIVDSDVVQWSPAATHVPGFLVDWVIHAPFGAHPTSHVPRYVADPWALMDYVDTIAERGGATGVDEIIGPTEEEYGRRHVENGRRAALEAIARAARAGGARLDG